MIVQIDKTENQICLTIESKKNLPWIETELCLILTANPILEGYTI